MPISLNSLNWDNQFAQLGNDYSTPQAATAVAQPQLICANQDVADLLDLDLSQLDIEQFARQLAGNEPIEGAQPVSAIYAGHQFGHFVSQLGDGRAILLGQVRNKKGQLWDVQVKGAGPTPYSRSGDGRAVLRSSIREYLASESMHHAGVPSTRALALIGTGDLVQREAVEAGAIVVRVAPSHIRFGSFELFFYRNQHDKLKPLADYVLREYEPDLLDSPQPYLDWLERVVTSSAEMVAAWQAHGFAHGVLNTDNMSVHGITLDYGPFGLLDTYKPDFICNHSDQDGMYAFSQQPRVVASNLTRFAQALLPLFGGTPQQAAELANERLGLFPDLFRDAWMNKMRNKLGMGQAQADDEDLIGGFLQITADHELDYTRTFRAFASQQGLPSHFDNWLGEWQARTGGVYNPEMLRHNPKYVLRNHLAQNAITQAELGNYDELKTLAQLLRSPFDEQPQFETYADAAPAWAQHLEISCSS